MEIWIRLLYKKYFIYLPTLNNSGFGSNKEPGYCKILLYNVFGGISPSGGNP